MLLYASKALESPRTTQMDQCSKKRDDEQTTRAVTVLHYGRTTRVL